MSLIKLSPGLTVVRMGEEVLQDPSKVDLLDLTPIPKFYIVA